MNSFATALLKGLASGAEFYGQNYLPYQQQKKQDAVDDEERKRVKERDDFYRKLAKDKFDFEKMQTALGMINQGPDSENDLFTEFLKANPELATDYFTRKASPKPDKPETKSPNDMFADWLAANPDEADKYYQGKLPKEPGPEIEWDPRNPTTWDDNQKKAAILEVLRGVMDTGKKYNPWGGTAGYGAPTITFENAWEAAFPSGQGAPGQPEVQGPPYIQPSQGDVPPEIDKWGKSVYPDWGSLSLMAKKVLYQDAMKGQ